MSFLKRLLKNQDFDHLAASLTAATQLASPKTIRGATRFPPPLQQYIRWLLLRSCTPYETAICVPVYLSRVAKKMERKAGLLCTPHRLFTACLILAWKYADDKVHTNTAWALRHTDYKLGGTPFGFTIREINQMELDMLHLLDWKLEISEKDIEVTMKSLLSYPRTNVWTLNDIYSRYILEQDPNALMWLDSKVARSHEPTRSHRQDAMIKSSAFLPLMSRNGHWPVKTPGVLQNGGQAAIFRQALQG